MCVCVKLRYGATFTEEECEEMFSDADKNGDGFIDFEVKYMGKLCFNKHFKYFYRSFSR